MALFGLVEAVSGVVGKAIDKFVPDAGEANRLKTEITQQLILSNTEITKAASSIVLAEVQGESWLQRNWRPLLMMVVVSIIANNYVLVPYINALFGAGSVAVLDLPERLWDLMILGVGGYVGGRTGEKMIKTWAETKKP